MRRLRLHLLGPPQIQRDNQVVRIPLRKAVALAAYLAVERRAFSREYLAALLWPNHGQERALANLRHILTVLRETLADGCILTEGDQVRMDCTAVEIDVHRFLSLARPHPTNTDLSRLEAAAALYRGSFLEGFNLGKCPEFDEWQDAARERMRSELEDLLGTICLAHLGKGEPKTALAAARRWLELDQLNEAAHRAIMEAHALSGRTDLAHKQYESCTRLLAREGIAPDELTRNLHDAVVKHKLAVVEHGVDGHVEHADHHGMERGQPAPRSRLRLIALVGGGILLVTAMINLYAMRFRIFGSDLSVTALEVLRSGEELAAIRVGLLNEGPGGRTVEYALVFSSDGSIGTVRDYVVYADTIRIRRNRAMTLEIGTQALEGDVDKNEPKIPPGTYTARVLVDPDHKLGERSKANNRLTSSDRFFYAGAASTQVFEVVVRNGGPLPLDEANPFRLFIGDISESLWPGPGEWAHFRVTAEGTYYLPLDEVPRRDTDGSGYLLLVVHDAGNNLQDPRFLGPGDIAGLYKEVADNVVYGPFRAISGTPIHPGNRYTFTFSHHPFPAPDRYETDDEPLQGTMLRIADLPIRQYHTFHMDKNGSADKDWFRVFLEAGHSITVETHSAGGRWESDTGIDINDSGGSYIRSGQRTSMRGTYQALTYMNDTGRDQVFSIAITPYDRPSYSGHQTGEYIVEFRR